MWALAYAPVPARRASCRSRAPDTRARTLADGSPWAPLRRSRGGTRGTSRRRSMRSSSGPLSRDPYLSLIHISEPTRLGMISYAVFCLKKKKKKKKKKQRQQRKEEKRKKKKKEKKKR